MSGCEGRPTVRDITAEDSSAEDGTRRASPLRLARRCRPALAFANVATPLSTPPMLASLALACSPRPRLAPRGCLLAAPRRRPAPGTTGDHARQGDVAARRRLARPASTTPSARAPTAARIRGAETAQVWLVEISDFQCPFCKQWHDETFAKIDQEYVKTGKVRLAYLNFPLTPHPQERAGRGRSRDVRRRAGQVLGAARRRSSRRSSSGPSPKTPIAVFDSLAARRRASTPKAWRQLHDVARDGEAHRGGPRRSTKAGVESTPTFFVGDRALAGAYPVDTFRVAIDAGARQG